MKGWRFERSTALVLQHYSLLYREKNCGIGFTYIGSLNLFFLPSSHLMSSRLTINRRRFKLAVGRAVWIWMWMTMGRLPTLQPSLHRQVCAQCSVSVLQWKYSSVCVSAAFNTSHSVWVWCKEYFSIYSFFRLLNMRNLLAEPPIEVESVD